MVVIPKGMGMYSVDFEEREERGDDTSYDSRLFLLLVDGSYLPSKAIAGDLNFAPPHLSGIETNITSL